MAKPAAIFPNLRDLRACADLWQRREGLRAGNSPLWHVALARRGLALGEPLFAYEVCAEGVERWKTHAGLRQVLALALARSGTTESARVAAEAVYKSGHRDAETLGLLGRIHSATGGGIDHAMGGRKHHCHRLRIGSIGW